MERNTAFTGKTGLQLLVLGLCLLAARSSADEILDCLIEPHLLVDVSSSEVGVFKNVGVDEADIVKAGDVIAELHTDVEHAALELSKARALAMGEQLSLLRRDYDFNTRKRERFDELHDQRVVSSQDIDEVRTNEDLARLRLRAAVETRRAAEFEATRDALALQRRIVRSPINGVVVARYKTAGEYVDGDPIVQLAQLDPLRVEIVAPISMLGQIEVGMQAVITPELTRTGEFLATVTSVDPIVDAASATFGVRLSLPNPDHLLPPGLKCAVSMQEPVPVELQLDSVIADAVPQPSPVVQVDAEPMPAGTVSVDAAAVDSAAVNSAALDSAPVESTVVETAAVEWVTRDSVTEKWSGADTSAVDSTKSLFEIETAVVGDAILPAINQSPVNVSTHRDESAEARTQQCMSIGPLLEESGAAEVSGWLQANDFNYERRVTKHVEPSTWMVLSVEYYESPEEMKARLQSSDIVDFHHLKKGPQKNRISFGVYRSHAVAERRAVLMTGKGFAAQLQPRGEQQSEIWLDLTGRMDASSIDIVSAHLQEQEALTLRAIPCTQLASE